MSWTRRRTRALAILAAAGVLGTAGGSLAGGPPAAAGEPTGGTGANCPASNPPNTMTLVAGTPQTATLHSAYATGLQVALTNTDGCAVTGGAAGVPVTFTAPSAGASGVFSASDTSTVTVGADSSGAVMAPTFTANVVAGSYTVTATSQYGSVSFALTNAAAGVPARIVPVSPLKRAATVTDAYRGALAVQVLDGDGNPVAGASVTFALTASTSSSACGTSGSGSGAGGADASFAGGGMSASATTNPSGVATSPALSANDETGTFTASAALGSSGSESQGGASASSVAPALFTLTNLAGTPAKLAPGVGATQSTRVGARFPVSLAVTVTDAFGNRVPDTLVSFAAPAAGPSARFTVWIASRSRRRGRTRQTRVASARTNACGIALAPALTANAQSGGYVVKASAGHARAAFALVNEAPLIERP